jgi:hypothetical protein
VDICSGYPIGHSLAVARMLAWHVVKLFCENMVTRVPRSNRSRPSVLSSCTFMKVRTQRINDERGRAWATGKGIGEGKGDREGEGEGEGDTR